MSNLDKERKSWFEIFRSWLVFNLEWRSNKINSVVDGALFFSRRFLDHISFHLKTTSFREPNKARNCLDVINSEYKISLSSLQLKRKQASLLTDTDFSIPKFTLRFVTLNTSRSSHKFRYTRLITSRLIETLGTLSTDDGNGDGDGRGYWENPNYQTRMSGAKMPSGSRHVAT